MYVLDTSALFEILDQTMKGKKIMELIGSEVAAITSFSIYEALVGASEKDSFIIKNIKNTMEVISFDQDSAERSSAIEKDLIKRGTLINNVDIFIAGSCLSRDATVVTLDNDFKRVPGIKILSL